MAKVGRLIKEAGVLELSTRFAKQPNLFVTQVNRLPADEADLLRQKLYALQARLMVIKRRLGQRAVEGLKIDGLKDLLEGSVGFILTSGDVLQTAKLIVEFHKAHEDQLSVRGALIDGQLLDRTRVEQLASLPPRPVLLAQVVATVESPIADVIFTIEQLIGDVAWLAEQASAKTSAETPTPPIGGVAKGSPDPAGGGTPLQPVSPAPAGEPPVPPAPSAEGPQPA